ncbi:MAG: methyltransferase domain-containing protein [Bacteroidia bacterium]|nr:methyltransferase domain-containing protein [Bacteroidia bacterium]
MDKQERATKYYNKFSRVYDIFSPKAYYHKARNYAVKELGLQPGQTVLNVPCGTGQNFEYFQEYLQDTGLILGVDISPGMLEKAETKVQHNDWKNIQLINQDVRKVDQKWLEELSKNELPVTIDAIICDLGLSGFPDWQQVIDKFLSLLRPGGKIVIMDWYMEKRTLRGAFVEWIGKGEVTRPIWQYLEPRVKDFSLDHSFNRAGVFVASGTKS